MYLRSVILGFCWLLAVPAAEAAAPAETEAGALLLIIGDQHSAYERTAQLLAQVDRLRAQYPGLPMTMLVDGDIFEQGNVVARRSAGAIDFAMLAALAQRLPTVVNLGNHEPEFYAVAETVARIRATGANVVGNLSSRVTGELFAPAALSLKLGRHDAVVVGVTTDLLSTFRVAVRPELDLTDPVVWARRNFPGLLSHAPIKIVLSHAGLAADRGLLALVPDGTLVAGAHDHAAFVHREGRTTYVHSGSWNEFLTLAYLRITAAGPTWEIQSQRIETSDRADPVLAELIARLHAQHLTPEDVAVVGSSPRVLSPDEAARFAVRAVRVAAGVDAAFVGRTTFGAGLPAGDVTRVAFDASVRFDGPILLGEVSAEELRTLLAAANENAGTPFPQRRGDYLVADGPAEIISEKRYRIAVADWVARNPQLYLGSIRIQFREQPGLRLKSIVQAALKPSPKPGDGK